jgi:hypothetical protein
MSIPTKKKKKKIKTTTAVLSIPIPLRKKRETTPEEERKKLISPLTEIRQRRIPTAPQKRTQIQHHPIIHNPAIDARTLRQLVPINDKNTLVVHVLIEIEVVVAGRDVASGDVGVGGTDGAV